MVALKVFKVTNSQLESQDIQQIKTEFQMLSTFKNENIIQAFEFLEYCDHFVIALELVEGYLLSEFIQQHFGMEIDWDTLINTKDLYK